MARRLGVPRSIVARAAVRAVVEQPSLVWGGPLRPAAFEDVVEAERQATVKAPPAPPSKRGRRRRRR